MAFFSMGGSSTPSTPATPAAPTTPAAPAPISATPAIPAPAAIPATPAPTTPATPTAPAAVTPPAGGAPLHSQPAPAGAQPAPVPNAGGSQQIDLAALMGSQGPAPVANPTQDFAAQLVSNMLAGAGGADEGIGGGPRISTEQVAAELPNVNFVEGVDMAALETALDNSENRGTVLAQFGNQIGQNVINMMVPLMNALGNSIQQSAIQGALTQGNEQSTIQSVVTAFGNTHAYASNPVVSQMLPGLAAQMEKMVQPNTPVEMKVAAIHQMLSSLAPAMPDTLSPQGAALQQAGTNVDFTSMFGAVQKP